MTQGRRDRVGFDTTFFARRAAESGTLPAAEAFRHAMQANHWHGAESVSGPGSSLEQTARIRAALPALCRRLRVKTLLDLPCGDCHWMSQVALEGVDYIGADLLPELVAANQQRHGATGRRFVALDLMTDPLPAADLLLTRDVLVHLSFADAARAIANIRAAEIRWLLTTTFAAQEVNEDVVTGDWRPLNLQRAPFHFGPPVELINEGCTEGDGAFADKSLGLWAVSDLPGGDARTSG